MIVSPDLANTEGDLFDDVVNEVDGISLRALFIDFEGANARCVIDGGVLEPADFLPLFPMTITITIIRWTYRLVSPDPSMSLSSNRIFAF